MINLQRQKGYTFIEIIIVLFVISIILGITIFSFNELKNRQSLDKQVDLIKTVINEARQSALNAKNGQDQYIIFSTTSVKYNNQVFNFENNVELKSYTMSTTTILFHRVSGLTTSTGTIEFVLKKGDDVFATSSIMINSLGIIE